MTTSSLSSVPVVWTEIGRRPGKYVLNAIKINAELFPESPRYLVLSKKFSKNLKLEKCTIVYEEDLESTHNSMEFVKQPKNWSWSQSSYWTNTTRRFIVLEQFMRTFAQKKLIHLESDCVLLQDDFISDLFGKENWGVKFTKQDSARGCASVFLVSSIEKLERFNSFILNHWSEPEQTDMTLLSKYQSSIDKDSYLPSGDLTNSKTIFDAGTIGRYFLGGDARNHRLPFSRRGLESSGKEYFDPSGYKVISSNSKIFLDNSLGTKLLLACVHVHSKRIPRNLTSFTNRLVKESSSKRGVIWTIGTLDYQVLKERVNSFLRRRFLRDNVSDPRYR